MQRFRLRLSSSQPGVSLMRSLLVQGKLAEARKIMDILVMRGLLSRQLPQRRRLWQRLFPLWW
jgi:hypothetical protein